MIRIIFRNLRAAIKFTLFLILSLLSLVVSLFTFNFSKKAHEKLIKIYLNTIIRVFGIRINQEGLDKIPKSASLFVSNHTSYVDILVLGSLIKVRFTPKIELSKWPFLNIIINLSLPVYIQRRGGKTLEQKQKIREIIDSGDSIIVFPEGTTNDGKEVLPFKSSLFSVAEDDDTDKKIAVQPISIIYTEIDGAPTDNKNIDLIAWYGDMKFLPHFWCLMQSSGAEVKIIFHNEEYYQNFSSRKELAKHCEDVISKSFEKEKVK